ncbi:MAG: T9SS type A sorting domain-containing protein [Bacteroidales bacterium]|nr:T9SS type A sorting domain-containing protein [Bacteroidales bacterium]
MDDYITLDVSGLHPGTYLLTVTTPSGSRTARFIRK